jgi:radical SAM protein with 4Fe4S-binding SPASM domain
MSDFKFYPQVVVWEITFACNMRCLHCGTAAGKKRPDELTTREALDLIDELARLGCGNIVLSGGEPLLRPDWRQLAERVKNNGVKCCLISNGYAVTREVVDDFERLGLDKIGISFDGSEKTHNYIRQREDSWKKAYSSMKLMSENGHIPFVAVSQISNINLGELDNIRDALIDVGCKEWRIQMTTSTGRMMEHKDLVLSLDNFPRLVDRILELKNDSRIALDVGENIGYYGCKGYQLQDGGLYYGCYAGMRVAGIESDGKIKGCLSMPEEFVEGNIRDSSFTEIWNRPDGFAYNRKFTRETASGACHDCKYLPLCRGGCATTSVSATGCRADNPYCIYQFELRDGITCEDMEVVRDLLEPFKDAMAGEFDATVRKL